MIINKTSHDIKHGEHTIKAMHSDFLGLDEDTTKVTLNTEDFGDSQEIDLKELGMTGTITMDSHDDQRQLQFGVTV